MSFYAKMKAYDEMEQVEIKNLEKSLIKLKLKYYKI